MDNFFKDVPFDLDLIDGLDSDSVTSGVEMGNLCLQNQVTIIERIRKRCITVLGWIIAAIVALLGFFVVEIMSDSPEISLLLLSGYGLTVCGTAAFILIYGSMYKRTVYPPGDSPSHFFFPTIVEYLKENIEVDKKKCLLGYALSEIQFRIMENKKEQAHEVKMYRCALYVLVIGLISSVFLLLIFKLLFP
jgi:hypothetical protein